MPRCNLLMGFLTLTVEFAAISFHGILHLGYTKNLIPGQW